MEEDKGQLIVEGTRIEFRPPTAFGIFRVLDQLCDTRHRGTVVHIWGFEGADDVMLGVLPDAGTDPIIPRSLNCGCLPGTHEPLIELDMQFVLKLLPAEMT